MKKWNVGLIIVLLAAPLGSLSAQEDGKPDRAKRPDRPAANGRFPDARPGQGPQGRMQRQGRPQVDPARIVERMLQEFDDDGDKKLDAKELVKLFTAMRERGGMMRGMGPGQGPGAGQPGNERMRRGQRPGGDAAGRFRGRPGNAEEAGGEKPKRPESDDSSNS